MAFGNIGQIPPNYLASSVLTSQEIAFVQNLNSLASGNANNVVLINANPSLTPGSVLFAGTGGGVSQNNSNFFWDDTNKRLGIGTTSPTNPLDIHINSSLPQNDLIRLTQEGAFASAPVGISFFNSAGNIQMASIEAMPGASYTDSQLRFFVANSSKVRTQRMVIDVNGNVGIGTTNPVSLLTVGNNTFQVNSSGNLIKINNVTYSWPSTQGGANTVLINDGSGNLSWGTAGGGGGISGSGTAGQVAFWTGASSISGNNNLFWDDTNSRLGIGTTTPSEKLHIVGNALITGIGTFQSSPLTIGNLVLSHTGLTASRTFTFPNATTTLVGVDTTQSLSNKRIFPRQSTQTSPASITPDKSQFDEYYVTALANAITINNATSPSVGDTFVIYLTDDGTARSISWGTHYIGIGSALPTSTTANKTMEIIIKYVTTTKGLVSYTNQQ